MSTLAIRRRAAACPAALTILLTLCAAPAPAAAVESREGDFSDPEE